MKAKWAQTPPEYTKSEGYFQFQAVFSIMDLTTLAGAGVSFVDNP